MTELSESGNTGVLRVSPCFHAPASTVHESKIVILAAKRSSVRARYPPFCKSLNNKYLQQQMKIDT